MGTNGPNLQDLFNQRFGAGSYEAGVNNAYNAGRAIYTAKQQAIQQQLFEQYQKQMEAQQKAAAAAQAKLQKPINDLKNAADYWNQNKDDLLQKGAYRAVQDLQNDPELQAQLRSQGYDIKSLADQAYNVATDGKIKSAAGFKEFYKSQEPDAATRKQNQSEIQDQIDSYNQQKKASGLTDQQMEDNAWKQMQQNGINQTMAAIGQNGLDTQQRQTQMYNDTARKAIANSGIGGFGDELQRGIARGANSLFLGLPGQLYSKLNNGEQSQMLMDRHGSAGNLDKATDFLGTAIPFALTDGATGALGLGAGLAEKGVAGKIAQTALRGAVSGGVVNAGEQGVRYGFNPDQFNASDAAKELGMNALYGAGGGVALHGAGSLLGHLNLKGQLNKVLDSVGGTPFNANEFQKAWQDAAPLSSDLKPNFGQSSAPQARKLIGDITLPGNQSEAVGNVANQILNKKPVDVSNNNWFNFAQQGGTPKGRGMLQDVSVPKAQSGTVRGLADDTLNKVNEFSNAPAGGFNQRLLNVQQEMKGLQNNAQALAEHHGGSYAPNVEDLYQQVKQPNDPKTFDDLVKMAQMEHGAANPSLTSMLQQDPRVKQKLDELNALGKSSAKAAPKVEVPTPSAKQTPKDLMQGLYTDRGAKPKAEVPIPKVNGKSGVSDNLLLSAKVTPLKSIKTSKLVETMNSNELHDVMAKLDKQEELLSKGGKGSEAKLKAIQEDKQKVSDLLMKLDLQQHGANAPKSQENPFNAPYKGGEPLPDTSGHIGTKTEKSPLNIKTARDKGYIKVVDNLHRLSQFDKQVSQVLGKDLNPSESTHLLGLNSRGSDMISKHILTENMVNKNGESVGKSLKDITLQVPKGKLKEFEDYLVNKHAITRMERSEKVFPDEMKMTTGKSQEIVKKYEEQFPTTKDSKGNDIPGFKDLAKQYYEYNKQLGQHWLVDTGILSKKDWEGYLKANPHYVPNNRIFSDLEQPKFGNSANKGFAGQTNPVKSATGSQRQIVSPIESTIEHTAQYVKTAKRNEVMQTLINNIKQDPEAFKGWAEILPTEKGAGTFLDSVSNKLKNEGIDGVLEEFNKAFDQKPDLAKGNVVSGIIDGQKVHVRVNDPQLLDALTNLQPKAQNIIIHSLGQVTRVMKTLTTGINPVFSLTRNIFRDVPTAFANSKSTNNPFTFSKDLVQSVVSVMKNDELYRSFKAVGGGHASPISSDANLLAQSKQSILPQKGLKPLLNKGLGALENLNNAVESAPRLAEFKRFNGDTYDSKMKALYEANDVTVNFNKYGNVSKEIDAVVPYFNAAIQGLDKVGRTLLNPKTAPIVAKKAFVAVTIPSIIDFVVNHNNPDYQKLSNYIKDNNIVIPKGDGTFYKIPVPRELGAIFHSGVTRVLRAWVDQDPKAFDGFATNLLNNFAPPTRSTLVPFTDIQANKNYMGAPIVPTDLQSLSPRYQYDAQTSEPSKAIGNILNVSPKQIDYLIKSYGGVLGQLGIPATTKNGSIGQTLNQQVTADPVFSNDIMSNFYNQKAKLDQAHTDLTKQGVTTGDLNERTRKMMDAAATQIAKIRQQSKQVQNDQSLTPQQRLARLRQLQDLMNQKASMTAR